MAFEELIDGKNHIEIAVVVRPCDEEHMRFFYTNEAGGTSFLDIKNNASILQAFEIVRQIIEKESEDVPISQFEVRGPYHPMCRCVSNEVKE